MRREERTKDSANNNKKPDTEGPGAEGKISCPTENGRVVSVKNAVEKEGTGYYCGGLCGCNFIL